MLEYEDITGNMTVDRILLRKVQFILHQDVEEDSGAELRARISSEVLESESEKCAARLTIHVDRLCEEQHIFECEVCYEGNFTLTDMEQQGRHRLLMTRCLDILYPYAHATLVQCSNQAGFRDVYLTPIHFDSLYHHQKHGQEVEPDVWAALQGKVVRH